MVPVAPALPFEFVGRLDDRDDQQVFLQSGEKLYVVRRGDVIGYVGATGWATGTRWLSQWQKHYGNGLSLSRCTAAKQIGAMLIVRSTWPGRKWSTQMCWL